MSQSDTRSGTFRVLAGEDLTDKKGYLAVLTHDTGVPEVILPASNGAYAFYLIDDDGADAEYVDVEPLESGRNVRAVLKGTCKRGDRHAPVRAGLDGRTGVSVWPVGESALCARL